jgi:hypothetical protein
LKIGSNYVKNVDKFKYLGLTLSNSNRKPDAML